MISSVTVRKQHLKKIHEIVLKQNTKFEKIYTGLLQELEKHNIHIINEKELKQEQAEFVRDYFHKGGPDQAHAVSY